jgi:hypothetical protein
MIFLHFLGISDIWLDPMGKTCEIEKTVKISKRDRFTGSDSKIRLQSEWLK